MLCRRSPTLVILSIATTPRANVNVISAPTDRNSFFPTVNDDIYSLSGAWANRVVIGRISEFMSAQDEATEGPTESAA
jgi:hypothetical protein